MSVNISIRHVPERVRDELAARAARRGHSMQEYLLEELTKIASRPSLERWVEEVRERKGGAAYRLDAGEIVRHIRDGRR